MRFQGDSGAIGDIYGGQEGPLFEDVDEENYFSDIDEYDDME